MSDRYFNPRPGKEYSCINENIRTFSRQKSTCKSVHHFPIPIFHPNIAIFYYYFSFSNSIHIQEPPTHHSNIFDLEWHSIRSIEPQNKQKDRDFAFFLSSGEGEDIECWSFWSSYLLSRHRISHWINGKRTSITDNIYKVVSGHRCCMDPDNRTVSSRDFRNGGKKTWSSFLPVIFF